MGRHKLPEQVAKERRDESIKKAKAKYEKKFSSMKLRLDKEFHDRLKEHAEKSGLAMNTYIIEAVREKMERENCIWNTDTSSH